YVIATFLPSKAYILSFTSPISFIVAAAGFTNFFNNTGMSIVYVFPSICLGFLATCFWGFLESRIRWQASYLRNQFVLPKESPMPKANWLSRIGFCWNIPMLKLGYQSKLEDDDVAYIVEKETVEHSYTRFRQYIKEHK